MPRGRARWAGTAAARGRPRGSRRLASLSACGGLSTRTRSNSRRMRPSSLPSRQPESPCTTSPPASSPCRRRRRLNQVNRLRLRVDVEHRDPLARDQPGDAELDRERGLAGTALLLRDAHDGAGHRSPRLPRIGLSHQPCLEWLAAEPNLRKPWQAAASAGQRQAAALAPSGRARRCASCLRPSGGDGVGPLRWCPQAEGGAPRAAGRSTLWSAICCGLRPEAAASRQDLGGDVPRSGRPRPAPRPAEVVDPLLMEVDHAARVGGVVGHVEDAARGERAGVARLAPADCWRRQTRFAPSGAGSCASLRTPPRAQGAKRSTGWSKIASGASARARPRVSFAARAAVKVGDESAPRPPDADRPASGRPTLPSLGSRRAAPRARLAPARWRDGSPDSERKTPQAVTASGSRAGRSRPRVALRRPADQGQVREPGADVLGDDVAAAEALDRATHGQEQRSRLVARGDRR